MSGRDGKRTRSSHPLSTSAQRTPSLLSAPPTTAGMAAQAGRGRLGCARSLSPPAWGPLLCTCKDGFHPFLHGAGKAWRGGGLAVGVATSLGSLQPPSPRRGAQRAQAAAVRAGSRGERGAGGRGERPRESTLGGGGLVGVGHRERAGLDRELGGATGGCHGGSPPCRPPPPGQQCQAPT